MNRRKLSLLAGAMRASLFVFLIFLAATSAQAESIPPRSLPDPALTPGDADPRAGREAICAPDYARAARAVGHDLKARVFAAYGVAGNHRGFCAGKRGCEIDHLISLELGGANAERNLWPEPYDGAWNAGDKDRLENRLHRMVCAGDIPLAEAQRAIASDWIAAYRLYLGSDVAERR